MNESVVGTHYALLLLSTLVHLRCLSGSHSLKAACHAAVDSHTAACRSCSSCLTDGRQGYCKRTLRAAHAATLYKPHTAALYCAVLLFPPFCL